MYTVICKSGCLEWNFVFNHKKNDRHHQKANKKLHIRLLNRYLISQIVFELVTLPANLTPMGSRSISTYPSKHFCTRFDQFNRQHGFAQYTVM
jgi:hypothetical protein